MALADRWKMAILTSAASNVQHKHVVRRRAAYLNNHPATFPGAKLSIVLELPSWP
jgi:hypothetical protein